MVKELPSYSSRHLKILKNAHKIGDDLREILDRCYDSEPKFMAALAFLQLAGLTCDSTFLVDFI